MNIIVLWQFTKYCTPSLVPSPCSQLGMRLLPVCVWLTPGYGIDGDLHMLARSWVFVADVAACPERVVDLRVFARMVRQ